MANNKPDTSEYSSTKAPDTRKQAEEKESTHDARLIPGGAHGTPTAQGMAGLEDFAPEAADTDRRERR